jgi:mRNA-degrading endonuclease RelE of RelBE toxin-antitoxin system
MMEIFYSTKAEKHLKRLLKGDRRNCESIIFKIEEYAKGRTSAFDIKVLKGKYGEFKRLRVGNYRVIFEEKEDTMIIYEVKHRQEAYND